MVPALGEHGHVCDDADLAAGEGGEDVAPFLAGQIAMDQARRDAGRVERLGHMRGMRHGRAEHDRGPIVRLFLPMADHLLGDWRAVHDLGHFAMSKSDTVLRTALSLSCTPTSMTKVRGGTR